jgi:hypothetical protein
VEGEEHMKLLWEIEIDINKRYKDGEDWVYAKGKKAEIELIKLLFEKCKYLSELNRNQAEQLEVLDKWEAYGSAELELERVKLAFGEMTKNFAKFEDAKRLKEDAMRQLSNAEQYMKEFAEKIAEGGKAHK